MFRRADSLLAGFLFGAGLLNLIQMPSAAGQTERQKQNAALLQEFESLAPGAKVDLDLVLKIGYQFADSIQLLKSDLTTADNQRLRILEAARVGGRLSSSISVLDDRSDQGGSPLAAQSSTEMSWSTTYQKSWLTGTTLSANLNLSQVDRDYPSNLPFQIEDSFSTARFNLGLRQSFWKNAFGEATQQRLNAAELEKSARQLNYEAELGRWAQQIIGLYNQAWLLQQRVHSSEKRLKSQNRLLQITRLSARRGTAEKADVLNVEVQVKSAEQSVQDDRESLAKIWRQLVVLLKIPDKYLQLDPMLINLSNRVSEGRLTRLCEVSAQDTVLSERNPSIALLKQRMEQAKLNLAAERSNLDPDLYGELRLGGNSVDDEIMQASIEGVSYRNPRVEAIVGIDLPLDNYGQEAAVNEAAKQLKDLELTMSSRRSELRYQWLNTCQEGQRLIDVIERQRAIVKLDEQREKLEEDRFRLGRIDVRNVIAATNDLITARYNVVQAEKNLADIEWQLLEKHGKIASYIEQLVP